MKAKSICLLGILVSCLSLQGQSDSVSHINFSYDNSGNRISRENVYYQQKSAKVSMAEPDFEEEIESDKGLKIWPNPTRHCIYVSLNEEALKEIYRKIYLYDNTGKLISTMDVESEVNQMDMQSLPPGSYILRLIYGSQHKEWIIIKN